MQPFHPTLACSAACTRRRPQRALNAIALWAALLTFAPLTVGCAAPITSDAAEGAASDSVTALSAIFHDDFEAADAGPLAAPWFVSSAGATAASIVTSDRGQSLHVRASAVAGDFLIASREFPNAATDVSVRFAVRPARGASLVFILNGTGGGYASRQLRLHGESGALVAATASGNIECGALASDRWSTVTLVVRAALPRTFDVRIDDAATRCSELATRLSLPVTGIAVMDASNEGWGGGVDWDDFEVR
jgi:hypothetical protein